MAFGIVGPRGDAQMLVTYARSPRTVTLWSWFGKHPACPSYVVKPASTRGFRSIADGVAVAASNR
jgi:hypothetical protein